MGDKAGEGRTYGNIGIAYSSLGELETAIHYDERHLKIAKELDTKLEKEEPILILETLIII